MFYKLFKFSRPRFWLYTAGPYLIGLSATYNLQQWTQSIIWYGLFYFLIPANIFIYAINDYFDRTIDKQNPKKHQQEIYMKNKDRKFYLWTGIICILLSLPLLFVNAAAAIATVLFLVVGFFYSSPPLRFKTIPFIDSLSNFFYILPGVISYAILSNELPEAQTIIAASLWAVGMHLFSAIVDIVPDSKAGITTTATVLGQKHSLMLTSILWFFSVILVVNISPLFLLGLVYPLLPAIILSKRLSVAKVYWYFPWINALVGFLLFWILIYD